MASNWSRVGIVAWGSLGIALSACSAIHHDCAERRDCPELDPIDIGSSDDWWRGGNGGQAGSPDASWLPAGAAGEGGSEATTDNGGSDRESDAIVTPSITRLIPSNGARGVSSDVRIVIDFAQPMDPLATEAAYRSRDLPIVELDFAWDESETRLTLTPRAPLEYASATADRVAPAELAARTYHYGFAGARTRRGQALAEMSFSFSTLRRVALELTADAERSGNWTDGEGEGIHNCQRHPKPPYVPTVCIGDDPNNVRYDGFLSFDLGTLPAGISFFSSARLVASGAVHGAPELLGPSRLEHVAFGELGPAARSAAAFAVLGPLVAGSLAGKSELELSVDLTAAVADDYAHRAARTNSTQYRVGFAQVAPNGHWDDLELPIGNVRLALDYLIP